MSTEDHSRRDDERLLRELRRLTEELDPVPDEVTGFARAALGWRRIDAELAEILSDSALDPESLAATRAGAQRARSVVFHTTELEIGLEIHDLDPGVLLLGQLAPPARAEIGVQHHDATIEIAVETDSLGRFRIELARAGRIRLRITRPTPATTIETSWIHT